MVSLLAGIVWAFWGCHESSSELEGSRNDDGSVDSPDNLPLNEPDEEQRPAGPGFSLDGEDTVIDTSDESYCSKVADCLEKAGERMPVPTRLASISANLDAREKAPERPWNDSDSDFSPGESSNFSTAITAYDSMGNTSRLNVHFRVIETYYEFSLWSYYVTVKGENLEGESPGTWVVAGYGDLAFDDRGRLVDENVRRPARFDFIGARPNQIIDFDFGDSIIEGGGGTNGVTSLDEESMVISQERDGNDGDPYWSCVDNRCVYDSGD